MASVAPGDISTLHIVGFSQNALDREMENFCRFLPGFVWAKASVATVAKVWVRFDSQASALAALPFLDGQPFDMLDPTTVMKASLAKTDMNPEAWDCRQPRKGGASCVAGNLDDLLGLSIGAVEPSLFAAGTSPPLGPTKETTGNWQDAARRAAIVRSALGGGGETTPITPSHAPNPTANPNDTLVIMGIGDKSLTEDSLKEYFGQMEGFIALTVAPGKGGGHCFAKFSSATSAQAALEVAISSGLDPQIAKNSLDLNKLQGGTVDKVAAFANGVWDGERGTKRQRLDPEAEGDTLVLMGVASKGLTNETCEEFFAQLEGFVVSNFNGAGKGGGNYFVKFSTPAHAVNALKITAEYGLDPQIAKNSLDVAKLVPTKVKEAGVWS